MAPLMNLTAPSMVLSMTLPTKAVGDDDICFAVQDAVAFDVADKVEFAVLQQFVGLFDGVRTFDVFRADVDQPDTRLSFLRMECVDEFAADNGKLGELFGRAVDVRAKVEGEGNMVGVGREEFGDGGAFDTGYGLEDETCGCHECARVACGYGGLGFAFFNLVDGNAHGGVFFVL